MAAAPTWTNFCWNSNPLDLRSPKYIIDKVTNIWFLVIETDDCVLEHIYGGTPEDIVHSKNRAEPWYRLIKENSK